MLSDYSAKGSQRWLQVAVNRMPEALNDPLRTALDLRPGASIEWLSPLQNDGFLEYRDDTFLERLGCSLTKRPLNSFWPSRGPVWDGLARTSEGDFLLVEAKAHIQEMVSPASRAGAESRARIEAALREAQNALAPRAAAVDWSGTFYQYANRIAHLYLLRELNGVPAHLVFVYFLNAKDVGGPTKGAEWIGACKLIEGYLGLGRHRLSRYIHKIFVDVATLPAVPAAEPGVDGLLPREQG